MLIRKVWKRTKTNQLIVSIPIKNEENIDAGDYVFIKKFSEKEVGKVDRQNA